MYSVIVHNTGVHVRKFKNKKDYYYVRSYSWHNWDTSKIDQDKKGQYLKDKWKRFFKKLDYFAKDFALLKADKNYNDLKLIYKKGELK